MFQQGRDDLVIHASSKVICLKCVHNLLKMVGVYSDNIRSANDDVFFTLHWRETYEVRHHDTKGLFY